MALVLLIGVDPTLLKDRQIILEEAGHRVLAAMSENGIIAACQEQVFEVAVIGHRVPLPLKERMLSSLRQCSPSTRVVEMYLSSMGRFLADADSWLEAPLSSPQVLLEAVARMTAGGRGS